MVLDGNIGHLDQIKQVNLGTVYRLIDQFGPISRIELSKLSQLAPASITKIVRELMDAHLVKETEYQEPGTRGRPAIGLIVDSEGWHYLSARVNKGNLLLSLRDLSNHILIEECVTLPLDKSAAILQILANEIHAFFTRHQKLLERLTAIAVTLPGIINSSTGVVHRMPYYDVQDMPLSVTLHRLTGLSIFIQQDVCAWTMAEALYGASKGYKNIIQVVIDHNVGAGIIVDGNLLNLGTSSAVEIGHTQVEAHGQRCYCGNHGCLETVASITNVLEFTEQRLLYCHDSLLNREPLSVISLCQAALSGDNLAKTTIQNVGGNVGRIIAMMVNIFNPQKILIGSPLNQAQKILFPVIETTIRQQALPRYSEHLIVEPTKFSNSGTIPGAALVKYALYNGSLLIKLLQG